MITTGLKILITCSGTGNRLGNLTTYCPKALIRIGERASINYIIDNYPKHAEFIITLGYMGNLIQQFLEITYPDRKFTFVEVDKYEGQGSSLLYSMLCAKNELSCSFIFHACDTIIENDFIPEPTTNWLGGYAKQDSSQYRTLNVENDIVVKLNDKGSDDYDYEYVGLCGIKDYKIFWEIAQDIYNKNTNDTSLSDCDVIRKMLSTEVFESFILKNWLDIGNMASLKHARENISDKFEILDKDDESIFIVDNHVIKFFYNKEICKNRVLRAEILKGLVPEIVASSDNFYKYRYVDGELYSKAFNILNFKQFLQWGKDKLWEHVVVSDFKNVCKEFYINKTVKRINKFLTDNNVNDKEQIINGVKVPSIKYLIDNLDINYLCEGISTITHGDLVLENIILNNDDSFTLIDWRQDFGGILEYGDVYYDISKTNHNLTLSHDLLHKHLFTISTNNDGSIVSDVLRSEKSVQCQEILKSFVISNGWDWNKVKIITALIWLNMSPLHSKDLSKFLFYFGKYNLYLALKENNGAL